MMKKLSSSNISDMRAVLVISVILYIPGICSDHYNCLTWTIEDNNVSLICRINNLDVPVSFIDPFGNEQGSCEIKNSTQNCGSHHKNGSLQVDVQRGTIVFMIANFNRTFVDGKWICLVGQKEELSTVVSVTKGYMDSTDLHIDGYSHIPNKMKLRCYSCREPRRNSVEFIVDQRSEDNMRYSHDTDTCFHVKGECHPDVCRCSKSGTEFTRIFPFINNTHFSCDMTFTDDTVSSRYRKIATVVLNGTDFIRMPTETQIIKAGTDDNDRYNSTEYPTILTTPGTKFDFPDQELDIWVVTGVLCLILVISCVAVVIYGISKRIRNKKNMTESEDVKLKTLTSLLDKSKRTSEENEYFDNFCELCSVLNRRSRAFVLCIDCQQKFCHECIDCHKAQKISEDHCFVEIENIPDNYDFSFVCTTHMSKFFKYFCTDDDEVCCKECLTEKHKECKNIQLIDHISAGVKHSKDYETFIKTLNWCREEMDHEKKEIQDSINTQSRRTDMRFIDVEIEKQNPPKEEQKHRDMIEWIDRITTLSDFLVTHGSENNIFLLIHSTKRTLAGYKNNIDKISCEMNPSEAKFAQSVIVKTMVKETEFDNKYLQGHQISGMASKNGLLLLCDCIQPSVLVYNEQGEYLNTIKVYYMPWDIAVIPNSDQAVTSCVIESYIQFLNTTKMLPTDQKLVNGSEGGGIASSEKFIFVGGKNKIFVMDHQGNALEIIENIFDSNRIIRYLYCVGDGICFSFYGSNAIICIDLQQNELFRYHSPKLVNPMKIIGDDKGNIYILGRGSSNIVQLSKTGQYKDIPLKQNEEMNSPWAICFNTNYTKIYISNRLGTSILVYKLIKTKA